MNKVFNRIESITGNVITVKATDVLEVDTEDTNWSWDGKEFYRVKTPSGKDGWAIASALRPV